MRNKQELHQHKKTLKEKERGERERRSETKILTLTNICQGNVEGRKTGGQTEIIDSRCLLVKLLKTKHREGNFQAVREKRSCR